MKINLKEEVIEKYNEISQNNNFLNEVLSDFVVNQTRYEDEIIRESKKSEDEFKEYISEKMLGNCFTNEQKDIKEKFKNIIKKNLIRSNVKDYLNNPYIKNIKPKTFKYKKYLLDTNYYAKGEIYNFDEVFYDKDNFTENNPIAYFTSEFDYLIIAQDDVVWMLITPYEINTMKDSIANAHGNVLVCGLGLGYYQYMIMQKKNVDKVITIEYDRHIIDIFRQSIEPLTNKQFNIVKGDCFKLIGELIEKENINYVYFDIYHDSKDGLLDYLKCKKISRKYPNVTFDYWIENTILSYLKNLLFTCIYESYYHIDYEVTDYNYTDALIDYIGIIYENLEINSEEELVNLFSLENIKELAEKLVDTISEEDFEDL